MRLQGRPGRRWKLACAELFVTCASFSAVPAGQVRQVNIEEMTARAASIFAGRCIAVSSTFDATSGGDVTVATFEVIRSVKGDLRGRVTVRVPKGDDEGATGGLPAFREGEKVVLFLYGESAIGLTSPVGLGQGRFRILTGKQGRPVALNDLGNRNLMRGLSDSARARLGAILSQNPDEAGLAPAALMDIAAALAAQAP